MEPGVAVWNSGSIASGGERLALVDRAHRVDGVRLLRPLVGTVGFDPGEAQRQAARVVRAHLQVVEGDLDDQLGAHVDGIAVARDLTGQQLLGLPGEHLIGQAFERLAEHDEAAVRRVAGAQVQI